MLAPFSRCLRSGSVAALVLAHASSASADDRDRGVQLLVTETSILNYHTDNRDDNRLNDNYGEWLNRLNVQATRGAFTFQLRLDSALYFARPDPNRLAEKQADAESAAIIQRANVQGIPVAQARSEFIDQQRAFFGTDLSTRYRTMVYPSKISASYTHKGVDLTVGDFYAQFGRGIVLSLRKSDELATDTTIRGAKLDYRPDLGGGMRLAFTLLGGYTNPLRVDEVTGRQLSQRNGIAAERLFLLAPQPGVTHYVTDPQPSFSPDRIVGARLEQGTREVQVAVQSAYTHRTASGSSFYDGNDSNTLSHNARDVINTSFSVNVPDLFKHGSFYGEAALQLLDTPIHAPDSDPSSRFDQKNQLARLSGGQAFYGLLTLFWGRFTLNLEGKHYNRFYPVMPSISNGVTEFTTLQYNVLPTTEFIWNDTQYGAFNVCVTGLRSRVDVRTGKGTQFYVSVGRYRTYSERDPFCGQRETLDNEGNIRPPSGKTADNRNDVWDPWVGFEWNALDNRSHVYLSAGARFDHTAEAEAYPGQDEPSTTYYREPYHIRYDAVRHLAGRWSVQIAGVQRQRFKAEQRSTAWYEGENYLSVLYSPKLTAAFGYEYTTAFGDRKDFFSGQIFYRYTPDKTFRLFVGQTRPALRCVSGVCRQFPAFEGAKLEIVLRF